MAKYQEKRQEVVDFLIDAIEKGTAPWQQSWEGNKMPENGGSGYQYRGGNAMRLMVAQIKNPSFGADPRWCTFKQASDNGWKIKKGEKALAHTEFWVFHEKAQVQDEKGNVEEKMVDLNRPKVMVYPMFNATQIEGIPPLEEKRYEWDPVQKAEEVLQKSEAKIVQQANEDRAFYKPLKDEIHLPEKGRFPDPGAYYATALHELGHWTGHKDRLDRKMLEGMRTEEGYAREELVAEISSMFVQSDIGLTMTEEHKKHHAEYTGEYIKILKKDPNDFFRAVSDAEKAADYVLQRGHTQKQEVKVQEATAKVQMSATQDIDPKQIDDMKKFLREPKQQEINVYPAKTTGNYKGKVVHVSQTENIIVQQVGKLSFVVHRLDSFDKQPIKGENLKISYQNSHKPAVKENTVTSERKLSR